MSRRWLLALVWFAGALLLAEAVVLAGRRLPEGPDRLLWMGLFSQGIWVCVALAGASAEGARPVTARLGLGPGHLRTSTLLVALVGFVIFSSGLHRLLVELGLRQGGALGRIDDAVSATAGPARALAVLVLGLAPGFAEELLFRGWIQRGLERWLRPGFAVAASAALFGLAHVDPVHASAATGMGLYLGALTVMAGSIRPAIACHVANNALAVALLASPLASAAGAGAGEPWVVAALLSAGPLALLFVARRSRRAAR